MRARVVAATTVLALSLASAPAHGDPPPASTAPPGTAYWHMRTPVHVHTDGGTDLTLPPGYYFDEPSHDKLDAEFRRLQDAEHRLQAENDSLTKTLGGWQPGWKTVLGITLSSIALGAYLHSKL